MSALRSFSYFLDRLVSGTLERNSPALVRDQSGAAVYVVSGDTAQRTAVKVGLEKPDAIEILSGLQADEQVAAEGGLLLGSVAGS